MAVKAYEQVADALHRQVVTGELEPGSRLPTEVELASGFGVSRATVREALRLLAAQSLIRTAKGAGGREARDSSVGDSEMEAILGVLKGEDAGVEGVGALDNGSSMPASDSTSKPTSAT